MHNSVLCSICSTPLSSTAPLQLTCSYNDINAFFDLLSLDKETVENLEFQQAGQTTTQHVPLLVRLHIMGIQFFFRQYIPDTYPDYTPKPDLSDVTVDMWDYYITEILVMDILFRNGFIQTSLPRWQHPAAVLLLRMNTICHQSPITVVMILTAHLIPPVLPMEIFPSSAMPSLQSRH